MNLIALLSSNTRKNSDKDCLRAGGKSYSFQTVQGMAEKAAGLFQSLGLSKGDRIAIMSQNTVSFVVALYGAWMAGGVVVPVNHKLMPRRWITFSITAERRFFCSTAPWRL